MHHTGSQENEVGLRGVGGDPGGGTSGRTRVWRRAARVPRPQAEHV